MSKAREALTFVFRHFVIGFDRRGTKALSSVWQASQPQECVDEDAESLSQTYFVISCFSCVLTDHGIKDRKFFDSGDYALSKAGKAPRENVGTAIPNPEKCVIPISTDSYMCDSHISFSVFPMLLPLRPLILPTPTSPFRSRP